MAYVEPNGVIQIFKGINLDNRYMHTIYFANEAAQSTWFAGKLTNNGRQFTKQYYTRQNGGVVRLKVNSDEILDYTYMRFQNKLTGATSQTDPHSTKWFYAFITSINYINEGVTEITFEIDVMQTWFIPNGTIRPCMVLRNHVPVNSDILGHYLEAEPIGCDAYDLDEITCTDMENDFVNKPYDVVAQTTAEPNPNKGYITAGIWNGLAHFQQVYNAAPETDPTGPAGGQVVDDLYNLLGSWDANEQSAQVVSLIQFPSAFLGVDTVTGRDNHYKDYQIAHPLNLGNYVPQNIKLYGYPFSYLYISTMDGDSAQYRWEYFQEDVLNPTLSTREITFDLYANELGSGCISLSPRNYNGVSYNLDAKLVIDNFPKCAYAYDAYQAWIASGGKTKAEFDAYLAKMRGTYAIEQTNVNEAVAIGKDVMSGVSAGVTAATAKTTQGMMYGISGATNSAIDVMGNIANADIARKTIGLDIEEAQKKLDFAFRDAKYQPNNIVGTSVPTIAVGQKLLRYRFFSAHVRKEELRRLDDFLTVFGYAINQVQQPQINIRSHWTFVKTEGSIIAGNMPSSSKEAISRIIDGGIFFWRNGDEVGNFEAGGRDQTYGALLNR